jgi:hypothetical protein
LIHSRPTFEFSKWKIGFASGLSGPLRILEPKQTEPLLSTAATPK